MRIAAAAVQFAVVLPTHIVEAFGSVASLWWKHCQALALFLAISCSKKCVERLEARREANRNWLLMVVEQAWRPGWLQ